LLVSAAGLEAIIDFPEEVDESELDVSMRMLAESLREMSELAESYSAGRSLVRGWSVVITGPVNAGKSTLFNRLLDHDRAIVSPQAGTTRDTIAETVTWSGLRLRIQDTAGLRSTEDPVELAGISRSEDATSSADLAIQVRDGRQLSTNDPSPPGPSGTGTTLWVASHGDLLSKGACRGLTELGWLVVGGGGRVEVEAVRRAASTALTSGGPKDGLMIHTARQHHALRSASSHLAEAVDQGLAEPVLAAFAIRAATESLEEFVGRWDSEEVLDVLFEHFCIGK
jgi:tRNA modification GTPase